jgi:hypothetical protein
MEHQASRTEILAILEDLDPTEVPTMVRVMLEAGWMSETEALKWRQLIQALTDCSTGGAYSGANPLQRFTDSTCFRATLRAGCFRHLATASGVLNSNPKRFLL